MFFYRVEHRTKTEQGRHLGPYRRNGIGWTKSLSDMAWSHGDKSHLSLSLERFSPVKPKKRFSKLCGFATLDALLEWFDGWESALAENDFVVRVYDIPMHKLYFGKRQVVTHKKYISVKVEPVMVIDF